MKHAKHERELKGEANIGLKRFAIIISAALMLFLLSCPRETHDIIDVGAGDQVIVIDGETSDFGIPDGSALDGANDGCISDVLIPATWPMTGHDPQKTNRCECKSSIAFNKKWEFSIPDKTTISPLIIGGDGTLYFQWKDRELYALDKNGNLKWVFNTKKNSDDTYSRNLAIGKDGTIYMGTREGLYAICPDGIMKWFVELGLTTSSPVIDKDGTIYITAITLEKYMLYACSPDGEVKWSIYFDAIGAYLTPTVSNDGTIYISVILKKDFSGVLYSINKNGVEKWRKNYKESISPASVGPDGEIYVAGSNSILYTINPDGSEMWRYKSVNYNLFGPPPTSEEGVVYTTSYNKLIAVNKDGSEKWNTYIGAGGRGVMVPIIGMDGNLYVGVYKGFYTISAKDGNPIWRYCYDGNDAVYYVVIDKDGTLYLHSSSTVRIIAMEQSSYYDSDANYSADSNCYQESGDM